jgi:hypothetical protein
MRTNPAPRAATVHGRRSIAPRRVHPRKPAPQRINPTPQDFPRRQRRHPCWQATSRTADPVCVQSTGVSRPEAPMHARSFLSRRPSSTRGRPWQYPRKQPCRAAAVAQPGCRRRHVGAEDRAGDVRERGFGCRKPKQLVHLAPSRTADGFGNRTIPTVCPPASWTQNDSMCSRMCQGRREAAGRHFWGRGGRTAPGLRGLSSLASSLSASSCREHAANLARRHERSASTPPNMAAASGNAVCTVIVDGAAVFSCVTPVLVLEGRHITTLEGLGTGLATAPDTPTWCRAEAYGAKGSNDRHGIGTDAQRRGRGRSDDRTKVDPK